MRKSGTARRPRFIALLALVAACAAPQTSTSTSVATTAATDEPQGTVTTAADELSAELINRGRVVICMTFPVARVSFFDAAGEPAGQSVEFALELARRLGEPAIRVDFAFGGYFQQSWFTLHDGALFHADFLSASPDDAAVAVEIMSTWEWITPLETEAIGDAFTMAEMASEVDDSASEPDPNWFTDEFAPTDSPIYAVFQFAEGTSGQIVATWSREGEELWSTSSSTTRPTAGDTWGSKTAVSPSNPVHTRSRSS